MKKWSGVLAILMLISILGLVISPLVALADTAPESEVADNGVWGDFIAGGYSHNTFTSNGRQWVVYAQNDGVGVFDIIAASTDDYGTTWDYNLLLDSVPTDFRHLAVWWDVNSAEFIYARANMAPGNYTIRFQAYSPHPDGTVLALAPEQIVDTPNGMVGTVAIAMDELGCPWIAWTELTNPGEYVPIVERSSTRDVWTEAVHKENIVSGNATLGIGNITSYFVTLTPVEVAPNPVVQIGFSAAGLAGGNYVGFAGLLAAFGYGNNTFDGSRGAGVETVVEINANGMDQASVYHQSAFSFYDTGAGLHCAWSSAAGNIYYQYRSSLGNWGDSAPTLMKDTGTFWFPAIAGYQTPLDEDLIIVAHDPTDIFYINYTGTTDLWDADWTWAWTVPPGLDAILLHNIQYNYITNDGADSAVGFCWSWGELEWVPDGGNFTEELDYWWADGDAVAVGEPELGYYPAAPVVPPVVPVVPAGVSSAIQLADILLLIAIAIGVMFILGIAFAGDMDVTSLVVILAVIIILLVIFLEPIREGLDNLH